MVAEIRAPVEVGFNKTMDSWEIEKIRVIGGGAGEHVEQHGAQWAAHPFVGRNIEAYLGASNRGGRQLATHELAQNHLLPGAANQLLRREGSGEFDDTVVEKRRPDFDGERHADAVDFIEDVVGEIILAVKLQEGGQVIRARGKSGQDGLQGQRQLPIHQ